MAKIEENDILKLLRGEASAKKLKALEEWASSSDDNATDLEYYQKIYDESEHLSSYKRVDVDAEWKQFSHALHNSVSEVELLQYFDGMASPSQRKKVEEWRSFSSANKAEFNAFSRVITESANIESYKKVDANSEWMAFSKAIKGQSSPANLTSVSANPIAPVRVDKPVSSQETIKMTPIATTTVAKTKITTPVAGTTVAKTATPSQGAKEVAFTPPSDNTEQKSNRTWLMRSLAIAAGIIFLSMFAWNFYQQNNASSLTGDSQFATFTTESTPDEITISDGSRISLDSETTLTYFKDVANVDTRNVTIDGQGEFDVASMPDKPFEVKSRRSGVGIRVIGTKFSIKGSDNEFIEIIENIEGSVRAYSLDDTTNYVIMTAGDRYGFDGVNFVDLNDIQEDYNGQDYDLLYVLDYLMQQSDWKVISGSEIEFNPKGVVNIDLTKPYEEILEDLSERADFQYIKRDCEGCYEVRRFVAL